jgi:hypothetical protein
MFSATNWRIFFFLNAPIFYVKALLAKFRPQRGRVLPRDLPDLVVDDTTDSCVLADGRMVISSAKRDLLVAGEVSVEVKGSNISTSFLFYRQLLCRVAGLSSGGLYQAADHPLLRDIKYHRGSDRIQIIVDCCARIKPGSALDIGANMGLLSHILLREGVPTMSVEMNKLYYRLMSQRLRMYNEAKTFCGSVFELPHYDYDLVVALSIFHHFLVTEDLFTKFSEFLPKLRCEYMLFEPHQSRHGFPNAYIDFDEDEFCKFICSKSVLNTYERLAKSTRGRPIYLLKA